MIMPVFRSGRAVKFFGAISNFFVSPFYVFLVKPVLVTLPLGIVLLVTSDADVYQKVIDFFPGEVSTFLENSHLLIIVVTFTLIQLWDWVQKFIIFLGNPDSELSREDLHSILLVMNEIVDGKMRRFLAATKRAIREEWPPAVVFREITQPEQQIALQVKAIHAFFEKFTKNEVNFRVTLMRIRDGRPEDWLCFYPDEHPPKATIPALCAPSSAIMRALHQQRPIIVSDIQKELSKGTKDERCFVKGGTGPDEDGSIISFPIYCPNTKEPIYVLSILAKTKNIIEEKHRELYNWIFDHFIKRILIEHHLMIMKEEVRDVA